MLREFERDQSFLKNETPKQFACGKSESSLTTYLSKKLCVANKLKYNKKKQFFQTLSIYQCWYNLKMINSLLKKSNSKTICMQKFKLKIILYLQVLL